MEHAMNRLILAFLILATPALADKTRCVAVELDYHTDKTAVLDMRGRWVVNSWTDVETIARMPDTGPNVGLTECLARGLLAKRASISRNVFADESCPTELGFTGMEPIIQRDPIMQQCQPSPRCDPWDTCS
jgi:hypothetical protein